MKSLKKTGITDYLIVLSSILFLFGCIASSYQTAKTQKPGQAAISAGYMSAVNMDNPDAESINLLDLNLRIGTARGFDLGIAHTFDLTSENNSSFSTFWGDFKVQISNRDNIIGKPIFSLGLLKGYVYNPEIHITSIPFVLSIPVNQNITPTLQYRFSLMSSGIIPTQLNNPRHEIALGLEYSFANSSSDSWNPKIGFAVGTFNSLTGGEGDQGLIFNLGFTIETP